MKVLTSMLLTGITGLGLLTSGCRTPPMRLKYNLASENRDRIYDKDAEERKIVLYEELVQRGEVANWQMQKYKGLKQEALADGEITSDEASRLRASLKQCITSSQEYRNTALRVRAEVAHDQRELMYFEVIKPIEENIDLWNSQYLELNKLSQ
jgi:hypothetical protein